MGNQSRGGIYICQVKRMQEVFILSETCLKTKARTYATCFCRDNTQTSTESRKASVVFNTAHV